MNTGRLKRKLGDLGVATHGAKANENFCLIGTPLPPLEKSKDNGEFVPLWKQDVRDEKGRRRLHGAFTGGFSAGYFNSVGSKEGWAPSTFMSSRKDRAQQRGARPEDFMDEEDLQDIKDTMNLVDNTDEMAFGTAKQAVNPEDESIASVLQATILPPVKDSAGARILKKMGWKIGQGIGPRVTLRQRRLQDMQAFTGQAKTSEDIEINESDAEANQHKYPPRDTPVIAISRKDNFHGLGYRPGMSLNETLGVKGEGGRKPSGPAISAGFGLGALNDADEDDLDVYDGGAHSRNRVAYDFGDGPVEDTIVIGGRQSKGKQAEVRSSARAFNDGKPLVAGFIPSDKPVIDDRWYPLPEVPKGWKPDPNRVWSNNSDKENLDIRPAETRASHADWKKARPTADERAALLGEKLLPAAPRSIFDYMSKKDRERIQKIATDGIPHPTPKVTPSSQSLTVPHLEAHIAAAALRGFKPFTSEPEKQMRYNAYLQSQADSAASSFSLKPLPGHSIADLNKELEDYAKSAQIFKPVSGAMAGRFTSATVIDHGPQIHEGLYTPTAEEIAAKDEEDRKKLEENLTPKQHAAKMEMYGHMTRETQPWQPARLLCKRFGVKDPNPPPEEDSRPPGAAPEAYDVEPAAPDASFFPPPSASASTSNAAGKDLGNVGLGEDESQGRDTLTYERPSMDVFKAIFASDDEDSDEEDKVKEELDDDKAMDVDAPSSTSAPVFPDEPVDIKTFKPTFVPREGKGKERDAEKDSAKAEKKRKKKDKEKKKVLVSFAEEDGGGDVAPFSKKKRRKDKDRQDDDGRDADSMWVEKPRPPIVQTLANVASADSAEVPVKGRTRAIDFM